MAKSKFQERLEKIGTPVEQIQGVEGLEVTIDPRGGVKGIIATQKQSQAEAKAEEDKAKKKKKVVIGVAIGVGVISIIALIYLLRKK